MFTRGKFFFFWWVWVLCVRHKWVLIKVFAQTNHLVNSIDSENPENNILYKYSNYIIEEIKKYDCIRKDIYINLDGSNICNKINDILNHKGLLNIKFVK